MPDYDFKTTFWDDFSIAERFGIEAIEDTYKRAFDSWHEDIVFVTELVLVLNWKIWALYKTNEPVARVYDKLWKRAHSWCCNNLKGDDLTYYLNTTDLITI